MKNTIPFGRDERLLKFQLALRVTFESPAVAVLVPVANARSRPRNASLPSLQDGTPQHMSYVKAHNICPPTILDRVWCCLP
jgi:hypothetical protein